MELDGSITPAICLASDTTIPLRPENSDAIAYLMKLSEWLKKQGKTQAAFAEEIGVTQGRVWQITQWGTDSLRMALKIERATDGDVRLRDLVCCEAAE